MSTTKTQQHETQYQRVTSHLVSYIEIYCFIHQALWT